MRTIHKGSMMFIKLNIIPPLFSIHEKELKQYINENDSAFLGLFADFFKEATREELEKIIHGFTRPLGEYIANLHNYPALMATLMTVVILEGFGKSGDFKVYSHIEKLLGVSLTDTDKKNLWKAYRHACLKLGLSVSPRTSGSRYIVHEFLRQAGLPLGYVTNFCARAIKYADRVGLPDEDNPEDIKLWQQKLVQSLKQPFSKIAREAIARDETGYYVGKFISLYRNKNQETAHLSRLETKMLETILHTPQTRRSVKKAIIPQVILRNFIEYGVLFPSAEKGSWLLDTGEHQSRHAIRGEEVFVPFDGETLPPSVTLTDDTGVSWQYDLWREGRNNRLLIFSLPSGKLFQAAAITDKEISLEPGEYALMLQFPPRGDREVERFSDDPELFVKKQILLTPGDTLDLCHGPVKLTLKADEMPLILWRNKPVRGVKGNIFYPADDLTLQVVIPGEMKTADAEFYLELRSDQLGEKIHVPVKLEPKDRYDEDCGGDDDDRYDDMNNSENADDGNDGGDCKPSLHIPDIELGPWLKQWKPGVARVQVILRRGGSGRLMVRRSIVIWNGLKTIENRCIFKCDRFPDNLDSKRSENLNPDRENNTCTYRDETNRFFKMVFNDTHQYHEFAWAVPGIFLGVIDYADGCRTEKNITPGTTISVKTASRKMLKIYAAAPATLTMGNYCRKIDFSRVGTFTIPLGNLQADMESGKNTIFMSCDAWTAPLALAHLVSPFTAINYSCDDHAGGKKIEMELAETILGIRIVAENLLDGSAVEKELATDSTAAQATLLPGVVLSCFYQPPGGLTLYVSGNKWPSGLWLMHFYIKASGRWGMLTKENNQIYAEGRLSRDNEVRQQIQAMFQPLCPHAKDVDDMPFHHDPDGADAMEMFQRLQHALFPRYAAEIWHRLVWLEHTWSNICQTYLNRITDGKIISSLLRLSTRWRDDSLQEGELPSLHLGAMLPRMYGLDRNQYRIKGEISNSLLSVFKIMPGMANPARRFAKEDLEIAALAAFSNIQEVMQNMTNPSGFSWDSYKAGLKSVTILEKKHLLYDDQWIPGRGDYLGVLHYQYAVMKLEEAFENNLPIPSMIRGKALSLVREISSGFWCSNGNIADNADTGASMDLGLWEDENEPREHSEEAVTRREHYQGIIRFLSLFARECRKECRHPGSIDALLNALEKIPGLTPGECRESLAFLLYVGEDIFAFYLLLWELILTADHS